MDSKSNKLGIPYQTAKQRLIRNLLFKLAKDLNLDNCYRCSKKIETLEEFTIDHKELWYNSKDPVETFFNLDNIGFSHYSCNSSFNGSKGVKHPSHRAYNQGCRCDECKAVERDRKRRQRNKDL